MSLIKVHNLTKIYATHGTQTPALQGVAFIIEKGEFVAIMGPSGSGKSTLLHILGLLDKQTEGGYQFMGESVESLSEEELAGIRNKKMGFVFQAFNLLARTSVSANIKLPLYYSDIPEKEWDARARLAIEVVGLSERENHTPNQLSGGEKQRVAIARALVNNPEVIFADEPTGNLDSQSGKRIMEKLAKLNRDSGHTIVLITHENDIAAYARRVITIRDGKLVSDIAK